MYLRFAEQDRGCKPSTIRGYRSQLNAHLLPAFGSMRIEDITEREIERWRAGMAGSREARRVLSNKTKNHQLVLMHAILRRAVKVYGLPRNPLANVDRYRVRASGDIEVFSPEEIWALVRSATSEIDGTIFLTAAFTGLRRGELLGLRWRDIDFEASTIRIRASYAAGKLTTPKSGKVRAVPMAPDVASALARIGQRDRFIGEDEFVFAGEAGMPLNGDALSSRYEKALEAAGLRRLRFHYLRHLRYTDDPRSRQPARAGVDGARGHPDNDEVPPLRVASRGRGVGSPCVSNRAPPLARTLGRGRVTDTSRRGVPDPEPTGSPRESQRRNAGDRCARF